jgi:predicted  nucleic acid-binding Zn-ribbon protein
LRSTAEEEIIRIKSECRQQIIESEVESYKLRLNQANSEKDELLKTIKELEKKNKDLQVKYDANEHSWARLKTDMSDKQRKVNHQFLVYSQYKKKNFFFVV